MSAIGLSFIVIIVCSIYLYIDYQKKIRKTNELNEGNWTTIILAAFLGGFFAFFLFLILQPIFSSSDTQGFILDATIILSAVICGCTGWIVKTLKGLDAFKKDK
jgi:RsiW-degrading membrane proteinase PrsW (M82 family)